MKMREIVLTACIVLGVAPPPSILGQAELPSVPAALEEFAARTADPSTASPYPYLGGWVAETIMFLDRYPAPRLDSILDGLQALASSAPDRDTRTGATIWLLLAGHSSYDRGISGVVRRLEAVYNSALSIPDTGMQVLVLQAMSQQAEVDAAFAFLESVAREGNFWNAGRAFTHLGAMGPRGEAVLRQLHATGAVSDRHARAALQRLADLGFPGNR